MKTFGKLLALATDEEQAELINEAGRTLIRTTESSLNMDIQLCRIADRLDVHGKAFIKKLAEFVEAS